MKTPCRPQTSQFPTLHLMEELSAKVPLEELSAEVPLEQLSVELSLSAEAAEAAEAVAHSGSGAPAEAREIAAKACSEVA